MRQKRFQKIKLAAFASITAMILACVVVRIANADNEIQLNTFAAAPERAAEPAGKSARPIRISAPTNATKELNAPQHDAEPKSQADETLVLPDQWNLALRSADGTGSHRASETEPAPKELALPGVDPETDPPDNGNNDVNQQAEADASPAAETLPLPIEPLDSVEAEAEPAEDQPETESADSSAWWRTAADQAILNRPRWVKFDLGTVLIDTLQNSPRIQGVSQRTSVAAERIVQQDAAFDPNMLFSAKGGQVNDPVGNILTTGGANRLLEPSLDLEGGFERTTRRGGTVGLSQRVGLLNSNSNFFQPVDQGNARLSLSLTQPLFARSGKIYNERLLTQSSH